MVLKVDCCVVVHSGNVDYDDDLVNGEGHPGEDYHYYEYDDDHNDDDHDDDDHDDDDTISVVTTFSEPHR